MKTGKSILCPHVEASMRRAGPQNQACDGSWTADSHQGRKVEGGRQSQDQAWLHLSWIHFSLHHTAWKIRLSCTKKASFQYTELEGTDLASIKVMAELAQQYGWWPSWQGIQMRMCSPGPAPKSPRKHECHAQNQRTQAKFIFSLFYIYCLNLVDLDPKKKKTTTTTKKTKLHTQPKSLSSLRAYI